ncbi:hypothetical protein BJ165DRAFT_1410499 [Panaeolus papilionaceus]|nr:hypothetical protein BJ165DRAFT_1410499 [Panaeolus papilionaceus]
MTITALPSDILKKVIDIFVRDANTWNEVKTLSTISKFWRDECRVHIFSSLKVGTPEEQCSGMCVDCACEEETDKTVPISRLELLASEHPHTLPCILVLTIVNPTDEDASKLAKIMTKLTNIIAFNVYLAQNLWTDHLSEALRAISKFSSFQRLTLQAVSQFPVKELAYLTHLKTFEVSQVELVKKGRCNVTTQPPRLKSTWLAGLDMFYEGPCFNALEMRRKDGKYLVNLSGLSKLHFGVNDRQAVQQASRVLKSHRVESLEELSVIFSLRKEDLEYNFQPHIDAWILPNRRTLKVLDFYSGISENNKDPYSGLCVTLEKLSTNNVLTSLHVLVGISTMLFYDDYVRDIDDEWRALCTVLMKPGWKMLKKVKLEIIPDSDSDGVTVTPEGRETLFNMFQPLNDKPFDIEIIYH